MKAAIATLEIALDTMETNEPINRQAGNIAQADLECRNAGELRQALRILRACHDARDPIPPQGTPVLP